MVTFAYFVRTNRKHRSGRPQQHVIAIINGKVVGRLCKVELTTQEIVKFCSQTFHPKANIESVETFLL